MKKIILSLIISLAVVVNFGFINNVKAYEENSFTEGQCITDNSYLTSSTTEYSLSEETGTYSLSGQTYSDYKSSGESGIYMFYIVSNDAKVLYGLVPNYNSTMANENAKSELFDSGIVTTDDCNGIYVMNKTVVGNTPSDSSYINFGNSSNNNNSNNNNSNNRSNSNTNQSKLDESVDKLNSANTASPMVWSVILVSLVLISIGVYSLYKKAKNN